MDKKVWLERALMFPRFLDVLMDTMWYENLLFLEAMITSDDLLAIDILTHAQYHRLLKDENFDIALGTEAMWLSARALGCEAFIPGLANAFPEINKTMYEQGMAYDIEACRETQFKVNMMRDIMYLARSTQLAIYAMLEIRGILKAYPRAPFVPATQKEKDLIKEALKEIGML